MSTSATSLEMRDFGCIDYMLMPPDWFAPPSLAPSMGDLDDLFFYAPGNIKVKIAIYIHKLALPEATALTLKECLSKPPHKLSLEELGELSPILRGAESPELFAATKLATELWNGKPAIVLSGRELESKRELFWLIVDQDSSGSFLQEIIFGAPEEEFAVHIQAVQETFHSIRWRS